MMADIKKKLVLKSLKSEAKILEKLKETQIETIGIADSDFVSFILNDIKKE